LGCAIGDVVGSLEVGTTERIEGYPDTPDDSSRRRRLLQSAATPRASKAIGIFASGPVGPHRDHADDEE
jgi:hypothetical protein